MEESNSNFNQSTQKLPNATLVLVLGILSVVMCCCYGFISILLGGVALFFAKKDTELYSQNPNLYTGFSTLKTGKILSYIGIILGALYLVFAIWMVNLIGLENMQNQDVVRAKIEELFR